MLTGENTSSTTLGSAAAAVGTPPATTDSADVGTKAAEGVKPAEAAKVAEGQGADDAAAKAAAEAASKPFTALEQLKLADGLQVDEAVMKDFLPLAGKLGLTAGQAQALVEFNATLAANSEKARAAAQDEAAQKAIESLKADPEIGGKHLEASMKLAAKALVRFGGEVDPKTGKSPLVDAIETTQLADGSMLGDSAVFAKLLVNIGKTLSEDSAVARSGTAAKTAATDADTFHRELYPNSPELFRKS